jgi:hypothetical protein
VSNHERGGEFDVLFSIASDENPAPKSGVVVSSQPLLEQVDDGGDEVRDGVIDDYITVIVGHLVARGCGGR